MKKIISILVLILLISTSLVVSKPTPNTQNQYYIFGDNTDAIPMISFNWSNNETYIYPYNESLYYMNETGISINLANITGGGGGNDGYAGDMGHPHDQDLNTTNNVIFNHVTATLFGDGGNITNLTDNYAGDMGHPHDQDLNTTNNVIFNTVNATLFGDGGNITNISAGGDGYAGDVGHPHDQDLNTTSDVNFNSITYSGLTDLNISTNGHSMSIWQNLAKPSLYLEIDGVFSINYQSCAKVYHGGLPQNLIAGGGLQKIIFDTVLYDNNNDVDIWNSRFILPQDGFYQVNYAVLIQGFAVGNACTGNICVNGALYGGYDYEMAGGNSLVMSGSDIIKGISNDYIEIFLGPIGGVGNRPISTGSHVVYMSICKIA